MGDLIKVRELGSGGARSPIQTVWLQNLWLKPSSGQEPHVLWGPRMNWTKLSHSRGSGVKSNRAERHVNRSFQQLLIEHLLL